MKRTSSDGKPKASGNRSSAPIIQNNALSVLMGQDKSLCLPIINQYLQRGDECLISNGLTYLSVLLALDF